MKNPIDHPPSVATILREVCRIAFADLRDTVSPDGEPLPLKALSDDLAAAISSIETVRLPDGRDRVVALKAHDKAAALAALVQFVGQTDGEMVTRLRIGIRALLDQEIAAARTANH